jgi:hypothetical protein
VNILVELFMSHNATESEACAVMNHLQDQGLISDNATHAKDVADADAERVLDAAKSHLQTLRNKKP